jgi:hypothetical protein
MTVRKLNDSTRCLLVGSPRTYLRKITPDMTGSVQTRAEISSETWRDQRSERRDQKVSEER